MGEAAPTNRPDLVRTAFAGAEDAPVGIGVPGRACACGKTVGPDTTSAPPEDLAGFLGRLQQEEAGHLVRLRSLADTWDASPTGGRTAQRPSRLRPDSTETLP